MGVVVAYSAEISRSNPTCLLFLVDQSGSMADPFGGSGESQKKKADGVADATNRLLQNLVLKCAKEEGIRDYFHVGVLGYGASVGPAFGGSLAGRDLVPISEVGNSPARLDERTRERDDGAGGILKEKVKFPIWFEPVANGGTPMCQAITRAKEILEGWLRQHPDAFPPIVVNITDGEATDGDPTAVAEALRKLRSSDGEVLLLNVHLSSQRSAPVEFPDTDALLPDQFAKLLFRMSSQLTPGMRTTAQQEGIKTSDGTRGFVFNADMVAVIKFLNIGTRPSNLR
jgi:hypothetical protein